MVPHVVHELLPLQFRLGETELQQACPFHREHLQAGFGGAGHHPVRLQVPQLHLLFDAAAGVLAGEVLEDDRTATLVELGT